MFSFYPRIPPVVGHVSRIGTDFLAQRFLVFSHRITLSVLFSQQRRGESQYVVAVHACSGVAIRRHAFAKGYGERSTPSLEATAHKAKAPAHTARTETESPVWWPAMVEWG
jgi:hypothetical protein